MRTTRTALACRVAGVGVAVALTGAPVSSQEPTSQSGRLPTLGATTTRQPPAELLQRVRLGAWPPVLERRISVRLRSVSIEEALKAIAAAADVDIAFSGDLVPTDVPITVEVKDRALGQVLNDVLRGRSLDLSVSKSGQLVVVPGAGLLTPVSLESGSREVQGVISGRVFDASTQKPLSGVSVTVSGTDRSTLSESDGNFVLVDVPPGTRVVRARMIGYAVQEQRVTVISGTSVTVNFQLQAEAVQLEGVVAVGYGTQRKVNLTGAVGEVAGAELANRPVPNASQALQGLTPGVTVINRGGAPGRDTTDIKIRGIGTLGNANPLVLVDGIPGNINAVAPSDIQSISVLKDAASAAIYGSRAANGVILITTIRGRKSGDVQISYDTYYGVQRYEHMPALIDPGNYLRIVNEAYVNAGFQARYSDEYIQNTIAGVDPLKYPQTDWIKAVYSPAPIQEHNLGMRGGNDQAAYFLSVNYLDQDGMMPNTWFGRKGMRLNTDFNVSKRLKTGIDIALQRRSDLEPSNMPNALWRIWHDNNGPATVAKYPDGTYGWSQNNQNALAEAEVSGLRRRQYTNGVLNTKAEYTLLDGLTLSASGSVNYLDLVDRNFRKAQTFYDYWDRSRVLNAWAPNFLNELMGKTSEVNLRGTLDYDRAFGGHAVRMLLGYEQTANDLRELGARRARFVNNELWEINVGDASLATNSGRSAAWRLRSGFGRLSYNLQEKYLLEVNGRYDGSSRFAPGKRYGFFPSFSAGWRLSQEPFMRRLGFINDLKLRGSWGRLGNQDIALLYPYWSTLSLGQNYGFGERLVNGAAQIQAANADISWETTTMTNLGVDAEFLDRRLALTADLFRKTTDGILLTLPLPSVIGLAPPPQNAGVVLNRGWEASLTWRDALARVNYSAGLNVSDIRNQVVSLAGTGPYISNFLVTKEGYPIRSLFGWEAVGLFRSREEVNSWAKQHPLTGPGDIKYKDQNGDGVIDTRDKVVLGSTVPRYTLGANLDASYRGFDVGAFFQGALGVDTYIEGALAEGPNWEGLMTKNWIDRWTPENLDATMPRPLLRSTHNNQPSSYWITDASYVKLKNLQAGFTVPARLAARLGSDRLRLYVSGSNLLTFSKVDLLDPEYPPGRGAVYPPTRTLAVGANVQF